MSVKIEEYIKSLPNDIISGNEVQLPNDSLRKIFEFLNLNENDSFYHLGCGDGEGIKIALQEFHVKNAIGVDNNEKKIQRAKKLIEKIINKTFYKFNLKDFDEYISYLIFSIIIGGRIGYVIFYNFEYYSQNLLEILKIWKGGK